MTPNRRAARYRAATTLVLAGSLVACSTSTAARARHDASCLPVADVISVIGIETHVEAYPSHSKPERPGDMSVYCAYFGPDEQANAVLQLKIYPIEGSYDAYVYDKVTHGRHVLVATVPGADKAVAVDVVDDSDHLTYRRLAVQTRGQAFTVTIGGAQLKDRAAASVAVATRVIAKLR